MIRTMSATSLRFGAFLAAIVVGNLILSARPVQAAPRTFSIDSTQSYLSLAIPNYTYSGNAVNIVGVNRTTGSPLTTAWATTSGNQAFLSGTFATTINGSTTPGGITSVQFVSGGANLQALTSGNYRPNPAAYNSSTVAYNNNSAVPASFSGAMHIIVGNVDVFSLSNVAVGLQAAAPLAVSADTFQVNQPGNPVFTGLSSLMYSQQGGIAFLGIPFLPSEMLSIGGLSQADTSAALATLSVNPSGDITMTIPIIVPFSIQIGTDAFLNGTATGQIVATAVPEPSTLMFAALGGLALLAMRRRRA